MSPDFYTSPLQDLLVTGEQIDLMKGSRLAQQFARADRFYMLLKGQLSFYIRIEEQGEELIVGQTRTPYAPIGWSGINAPHRYSTSIEVTSRQASVLAWDREELLAQLRRRPKRHLAFLKIICSEGRKMVEETGKFLDSSHVTEALKSARTHRSFNPSSIEPAEVVDILRQSPFFEIFRDEFIHYLAQHTMRIECGAGDRLFDQGDFHDGMYFLEAGEVQLIYGRKNRQQLPIRTIDQRGYIFGWTGVLGEKDLVTADVRIPSILYFIPTDAFDTYFVRYPDEAIAFYQRILWLMMHQMQTLRAKLVFQQFELETLAIQNLVTQNAVRLSVNSVLHRIPVLLDNPLTLRTAFEQLEDLTRSGDAHERHLSSTCLHILKETRKEQVFYDRLNNLYDGVLNYTNDASAGEVRRFCAEATIEAFDPTSYRIEGWENLPDSTGHIFIYNHLLNDDYNTLPNGFQITLDSHFISALVLHRKYGDPGRRIVRIGRGNEYGHELYYNRLGHINVLSKDSETDHVSDEERKRIRSAFRAEAEMVLRSGQNLLISPEGTSYMTDESPGPFKVGAFKLAQSMEKEPLIIPIAMANFDHRVRHNTFVCAIQRPFYLSEHVKPGDKDALNAFLSDFRNTYRVYIAEARKLAHTTPSIDAK